MNPYKELPTIYFDIEVLTTNVTLLITPKSLLLRNQNRIRLVAADLKRLALPLHVHRSVVVPHAGQHLALLE